MILFFQFQHIICNKSGIKTRIHHHKNLALKRWVYETFEWKQYNVEIERGSFNSIDCESFACRIFRLHLDLHAYNPLHNGFMKFSLKEKRYFPFRDEVWQFFRLKLLQSLKNCKYFTVKDQLTMGFTKWKPKNQDENREISSNGAVHFSMCLWLDYSTNAVHLFIHLSFNLQISKNFQSSFSISISFVFFFFSYIK